MLPVRLYLIFSAAILLTAAVVLIGIGLWWTSLVFPTSPLGPFLVESWHPTLGRPFHVTGGAFGGLGLLLLALALPRRRRAEPPDPHLKPPPIEADF